MTIRLRTIWLWIAGSTSVLLLYVLSIGPTFKYIPEVSFIGWGYDAEEAYNSIYRPINWACDRCDAIDRLMAQYKGWWCGEKIWTRKQFRMARKQQLDDYFKTETTD